MGDFTLHFENRDGVGVLTLDRPPANALDLEFLEAIDGRVADLEADPSVKAMVIAGSGRSLSAGMDLKAAAGYGPADQDRVVDAFNKGPARLYGFAKPLVAAVNGHAIAGGLFFVITADYRIGAAGNAKFGLTEVRVGVDFPVGPLEIARAELTPTAARRFLLSGENVDAETALAWGVLDELVPAEQVLERAVARARDYAAIPPGAFAAVKRQVRGPVLDRIRQAVETRSDPAYGGWLGEEFQHASRAILEAAKG